MRINATPNTDGWPSERIRNSDTASQVRTQNSLSVLSF